MWLNKETQVLYILVSLAAGVATWVAAPGATTTFVTDGGSAVDFAGIINIFGGNSIDTTASGNTITINLQNDITVDGIRVTSLTDGVIQGDSTGILFASNGTDGQLLIGGGTAPEWAPLTSLDGSIDFTLGNNSLDLSVASGAGADSFVTDSGTATPSGGAIDIVGGGTTITTSATGNIVTVEIPNATNGQLIIGSTGNPVAFGNITSLDGSITVANGSNTIDLSAPTASGTTTFHTGSGTATEAGGAITITGSSVLDTTGSGSTVTVGLTSSTNGQLIIGHTSGNPAWANLTSMGGTVTITNGASTINLEATGGGSSGASTFITDSGNALEVLGDITMAGGTNISTSGSGQTVTFNVSGTTNNSILRGNSSGGISSLSAATNGQVLLGSTGASPAFATLTSTGGTITFTPGAASLNLEAVGGAGGGIIVTTFMSSGTWTKNVNTQYVEVYGWCGGGGGGSGARSSTPGSAQQGGGGGGAGSAFRFGGPEMFFGATETVMVGAGGLGAAGQTINNTGGLLGSNGGVSSFGNISVPVFVSNSINDTAAYQGGGGGNTIEQNIASGGGGVFLDSLTTRTFVASLSVQSRTVLPKYGNGGKNSVTNGAAGAYGGGDGTPSFAFIYNLPTSGGQGGTASTTTAYSGGAGGDMYAIDGTTILVNGGTGGIETGTINGGNGNPMPTRGGLVYGGTGGGGGGGQKSGGVAGIGGKGGLPGAGGGGGGGSFNGTLSGAGGNGADGFVLVLEYL
jgi:hypothetical protein